MAKEENSRKFKICLIGDGGVGKTTYINRVLDGPFCKEYIATQGVVVHKATFWVSTEHSIIFDVWDTAGQEKKAGLKDLYYLGADGAMFFYDVTSRISANNLNTWIKNFKTAAGEDKPIIVVANKVDNVDRKVNKKNILNNLKMYDYDYCEVSAKTTHNFAQPFLLLARKLSNNSSLVFVSNVDLRPTNVNYDVTNEVDEDYDFARQAQIEE
ncbi:GTP-binding nuclear protein GSP1 [Vairimorpha necatrix]|uniref:GTP-binding nuclear protein GSP1 n=1 Tax=Vairimorpha necatrix TaxID=6039 RepID=A0AAX4JG78_9MICR